MVNIRSTLLVPGQIYHVFNRGVERRTVFMNGSEYRRAIETINFYRFVDLPLRYSHFLNLSDFRKKNVLESFAKTEVQILAFCLMPNHFHFLLRQETDHGLSRFISNFTNSYSKFFNIKHDRIGPLFQGTFKSVLIETDEQFVHLSRYIHLNPVASFLIPEEKLDSYPWSSLPEFLGQTDRNISDHKEILNYFKSREDYRKFVHDRVKIAQSLEKIKHLGIDEEE